MSAKITSFNSQLESFNEATSKYEKLFRWNLNILSAKLLDEVAAGLARKKKNGLTS